MLPLATQTEGIQSATIKILNSLDDEAVRDLKRALLKMAAGGMRKDDVEDIRKVMEYLEEIAVEISEIRILGEKYIERG